MGREKLKFMLEQVPVLLVGSGAVSVSKTSQMFGNNRVRGVGGDCFQVSDKRFQIRRQLSEPSDAIEIAIVREIMTEFRFENSRRVLTADLALELLLIDGIFA